LIKQEALQKTLGIEIATSSKMAKEIKLWQRMYENRPPWITGDVKGLSTSAAIASEIARLVTKEAEITITGSHAETERTIVDTMDTFLNSLSHYVEYAAATGGVVFKPFVTDSGFAIDVVRQGQFFPVKFDNSGKITAIVFPEYRRKEKKLYTRIEYHSFEAGRYTITNKAYVNYTSTIVGDSLSNLGKETPLSSVPEWSEIEPHVELNNATGTLFTYLKVPLANNIDPESPLGVSVYSRAVNQLQDADEQYGAVLWEFKAKETAIQAADEFFKKARDGTALLPKGKERTYHAMGGGIETADGRPFFNVYSPEIRDESFFNGYNRIIQKVEFNSGLAYGTLSDPQMVDKTAEEIKVSKQRSYSTVKSMQRSVEFAITDLVDVLKSWMAITGKNVVGDIEVSCDWDDSLVIDKKYEIEQLRADLAIGVVGAIEYRMLRFKETQTQAIEMLKLATEYNQDHLPVME
jgi:A118 family predicted phage portal protein